MDEYTTSPSGGAALPALLAAMHPVLDDERWVFCTLPGDAPPAAALGAVVTVREDEGWTAVIPQATAEWAGLASAGPFCRVTFTVHSSLEAVGFLAAVAAALAAEGVACNAASGCYHDHLFVPAARAHDAMRILRRLATSAAARGA